MKSVLLTIIFCSFFSVESAPAKTNYSPKETEPLSESWRFTSFSYLDGKGTRSYSKDKAGNLWVGVKDGVVKYNGLTWQHYSKKEGLPGSSVDQLFVSKKGQVYAATSSGLYLLNDEKWINLLPQSPHYVFAFSALKELSDGAIVCGMSDGALLIKEKQITFFTTEERSSKLKKSFPGFKYVLLPQEVIKEENYNNVSDILEYKPGNIWIAFSREDTGVILTFNLDQVSNGKILNYQLITSTPKILLGEDQKILKTFDDKVYIINRSFKAGITIYNGKSWSHIMMSSQFSGDEYMYSITQSPDGVIWIGGLGKVYKYKNGIWSRYNAPDYSIPSSQILVFSDQSEKIWIGGLQSKLYQVDLSSSTWQTYLNLNFQFSDPKRGIWFLDVNGRAIYKSEDRWASFGVEDGLIDTPVKLIRTSKGQIWAAGSHGNVAATAWYEDGVWHKQLHNNLSWGIDYRAVFEARDGTLWFGASVDRDPLKGHLAGVLQLLNPSEKEKVWKHYKYREDGLLQTNAYGISQTKDGVIWLGGSQLCYYNGSSWKTIDNDYLKHFINIVHNDKHGNLYVGSRYYGVFVYDGKKWEQYNTQSGLESNTIISLATDEKGFLYVATDSDISCFDGKSWTTRIFPSDMNMSNEGGGIHIDTDGAIWINNSSREWKRRGLGYKISPEEASQDFVSYCYLPENQPPDTRIKIFTAEVPQSGNTLISWEGEDHYNRTRKNRLQYSFRLNGGEWSPFSTETHFTFLGLSSGDYLLEVKARDLDFNVDPTPAKIEFTVLAPVWKQAWFIAMLISFLILLILFEIRIILKNRKLSLLNLSLNEANSRLTHKNKKIKKQQEELQRTNTMLEEQKAKIETHVDTLQEMVQKVEVLSKAKTKFFTNITHEFRTPLSLIEGPLLTIMNGAIGLQEKNKLFEIIWRNTRRLQKLINQLLEIRSIETGTQQLVLRKENLIKFTSNLKNLFNNLAEQRSIRYTFFADRAELFIPFDQDKIEKILFNLLSNAFKYTQEGGVIGVKVYASQKEKFPNTVSIIVSDTGKGISPDQLPHIFDRFYSTFEKPLGKYTESSGIGLSYIKELVEFHQGTIQVESETGKGTTFKICIPPDLKGGVESSVYEGVSQTAELPDVTLPEDDKSRKQIEAAETILLVEDNPDMRVFLKHILKDHYNVVEASNGLEALQICKENEIDLILSDIMMPEMDGLSLCEKLKNEFETSHIPVLLLTAKSHDEHKMSGFECGADAYITKPFNTKLLLIRLRKMLELRQKLKLKFIQEFTVKPKEIKIASADEMFLNELVAIMEKHISDSGFDVEEMSKMLYKSPIQFFRKVKQLTGKKPVDLLKSFRLQRARQLLEQKQLSISEVAFMVGYDLPNSFSRAFRKEFGYSPSEFVEINGK